MDQPSRSLELDGKALLRNGRWNVGNLLIGIQFLPFEFGN